MTQEVGIVKEIANSVELTKNSKGYTWSIKIRFEDEDEKALLRIHKINTELKRIYGEQQ